MINRISDVQKELLQAEINRKREGTIEKLFQTAAILNNYIQRRVKPL